MAIAGRRAAIGRTRAPGPESIDRAPARGPRVEGRAGAGAPGRSAVLRLVLIVAGLVELPEVAAAGDPIDARFSSAPATAGKCASQVSPGIVLGETIGLAPEAGTPLGILERAIESWQVCPSYGTGFPRFVLDGARSRSVSVRFVPGSSGSRRCGSFVGSTVTLYGQALDPDGRPRLCADAGINLAHELGHVLGLKDEYDQGSCGAAIMAQSPERRRDRRQVSLEECRLVSRHWIVGTSVAAEPAYAR
jgi:hypothetical protein